MDEKGRMDPKHLEKLVKEDKKKGYHPFFVNCTSGTTVYGAFDPINEIADVCEKHNIWMHIDVSIAMYNIHSFFMTSRLLGVEGF